MILINNINCSNRIDFHIIAKKQLRLHYLKFPNSTNENYLSNVNLTKQAGLK